MKKRLYLVEVRTPERGETIISQASTSKEYGFWNFNDQHNRALIYPVVVGYVDEDDNGNVEYVYKKNITYQKEGM